MEGGKRRKRGESGAGRERARGKGGEKERKKKSEKEREGESTARASWEKECDLSVRSLGSSLTGVVCAAHERAQPVCCVPLRPGGHVTRSPAGGRTAHSASKSGSDRPCVLCSARGARDSVGHACGPHTSVGLRAREKG
jgi:hypothetical protein